ncbi:MAG: DUF3102 domain-containing protein [Planctomycetaceae bacterium]
MQEEQRNVTVKQSAIRLEDLAIEPLSELCKEAYEETAWALENTLKKAIHFGRLLCIAKTKVPHGKWISWVAETFEDQVSLRNIQRFMQVAESNKTNPSLLEGAKNLDEAMSRVKVKKTPAIDVVVSDHDYESASELAEEVGVTPVTTNNGESNRQIAKRIGCSGGTVASVRRSLGQESAEPVKPDDDDVDCRLLDDTTTAYGEAPGYTVVIEPHLQAGYMHLSILMDDGKCTWTKGRSGTIKSC